MNNVILLLFVLFSVSSVGISVVYADQTQQEKTQLLEDIMCLRKIEASVFDVNCNITDLSNDALQHTTDRHKIGLILSTTCLKLIQLGSDKCPTYELLSSAYSPYILINPDEKILEKIRIITIAPNLPVYKDSLVSTHTQYNNTKNNFEIKYFEKRFINKSCTNAIVESYWPTIGDTIYHMTFNCDEDHTFLKNTISWDKKATPIHILDFKEYQYNIWLDDTIKNCVNEYGKCK